MQRLNLIPPELGSLSDDSSTSLKECFANVANASPEKLKEIKRRTDVILQSGRTPEWVFLCGDGNGSLMFQPRAGQKPLMLLFTTPFAARDYIRVTKASAEAKQIKFDALANAAQSWIAAGVEQFVLNRCPRCNIMNAIPIQNAAEKEQFFRVWAVTRATQLCLGELKVREYLQFQATSRPRARAALEAIRDHLDCGVPYVHELIALLARMDNDEAAKAAAIDRLKEFGLPFSDWETRWGAAVLAQTLPMAVVGLATAFGIELKARG